MLEDGGARSALDLHTFGWGAVFRSNLCLRLHNAVGRGTAGNLRVDGAKGKERADNRRIVAAGERALHLEAEDLAMGLAEQCVAAHASRSAAATWQWRMTEREAALEAEAATLVLKVPAQDGRELEGAVLAAAAADDDILGATTHVRGVL